ncbi:MAG TPA: DNA ligase D [Candidatus Acidoferrales bacterium]|nr:DNA ligase D [Bryobacteraceae bacterium]HTS62475.1 DNA ligase D [Candidatus Acidoferrales bacterium]
MPLEEYVAKRKFEKTPEPAPGKIASGSASHYFCVQRHDATRLHYDFRLEIDGVLKSWAVPKGPTLDPGVKHLAAHVEDHPVEYGSFEGNIPAGNYGAGSVMLWDRGSFELLGGVPGDQQIARGDLKFRLHGEKLNGDFALVHMKGRGKGNEWLIIKKRDEFAAPGWDVEAHAYSVLSGRTQEEIARNLPARKSKRKTAGAADRVWESRPAKRAARAATSEKPAPKRKKPKIDASAIPGARAAEMPVSIEPMSASIADRAPRGAEWLFEIKWDGVRAIAFVEDEEVRLQARSGLRCERQYPELAVLHHHLAASQAILDGEIAVLDPKGVSRFHLIQPRIANSDPNAVAHLVRSTPVVYFVFDLLYLDGYDLRGVPLARRRELLEQTLEPGAVVRISEAFPGAGEELLEAARENGLEGILAKHAASRYESRRSRDWLKIKIVSEQEFVIGGFTGPQGDREYFGALVLGVNKDGKLHWVGNVGTGFDHRQLATLYARLQPLITPKCPFAERPKPDRGMTWVKPDLVCQVKFGSWTQDDRLRAPVFLGLRNDVDAPAVSREAPAELLAAGAREASLTIDGHTLKFTNLKKLYYPDDGVAKGDVLNYYAGIADLILPYLTDRPLSLKRYPNGIKEPYFFQKDTPESYPSWLHTQVIDDINYVFADDRASLLYLVNLGCIDHNPWMSRAGSLDNPDYVLIDLDPQECPYDMIVDAALLVKQVLEEIGLAGYPKTTGGDGMHIYIPLEPVYSYEEARIFAELISRLLVHERPQMFTTPRSVAKRQRNRVYFDYLQIGKSKTISAPYVLRAYQGAPVATPLEWSEVAHGLDPKQFHIRNARARFAEKGDIFRGVLEKPQDLHDALPRLEKLFR